MMTHIPFFDQLFTLSNNGQITTDICPKAHIAKDAEPEKVRSTQSVGWSNRGLKRKRGPVRIPFDGNNLLCKLNLN